MENLASGCLGERRSLNQLLKPQTFLLYLERIKTQCGRVVGPRITWLINSTAKSQFQVLRPPESTPYALHNPGERQVGHPILPQFTSHDLFVLIGARMVLVAGFQNLGNRGEIIEVLEKKILSKVRKEKNASV